MESNTDKLSRVRQMIKDDGQTWDLSPNDKAALEYVLSMSKRDCGWEWDSINYLWVTGCQHEHEIAGNSPDEIRPYEFCPYCGGKIVEESSE